MFAVPPTRTPPPLSLFFVVSTPPLPHHHITTLRPATLIPYHIYFEVLYIARNVVFYCLLVKANNAFFSCQLLLLFCGRFERSGVQASCRTLIRYTKRADLPTDVAVQVVSLVLGGVVYPW